MIIIRYGKFHEFVIAAQLTLETGCQFKMCSDDQPSNPVFCSYR